MEQSLVPKTSPNPNTSRGGGWLKCARTAFENLTGRADKFLRDNIGADLIIVTGHTGVGKSSFIKTLTGKDVYVGSSLTSGTQQVALVPAVINNKRYLFFDSPGFNSVDLNNVDVFCNIISAIVACESYVKFRGVLFVDALAEARLTPLYANTLDWLLQFCGKEYMPNVTVVTTKWSGLNASGIADKLERFNTWCHESQLGGFIDSGAKVFHHGLIDDNDAQITIRHDRDIERMRNQAFEMISNHYSDGVNLTPLILQEINKGINPDKTSAGRVLYPVINSPEASASGCESHNSFDSGEFQEHSTLDDEKSTISDGESSSDGAWGEYFFTGVKPGDVWPWIQLLGKAFWYFNTLTRQKMLYPEFSDDDDEIAFGLNDRHGLDMESAQGWWCSLM